MTQPPGVRPRAPQAVMLVHPSSPPVTSERSMSFVSIFVRHAEEKLCPDFTASTICLSPGEFIAVLPAWQPQGKERSLFWGLKFSLAVSHPALH